MKPDEVMREMELAMWELAEAGQREKEATALRIKAAKRISLVHVQMGDAIKTARETNPRR